MPVLTFVEERISAKEPKNDYRSLYIKNAGSGPALNIVRVVIEPGELLCADLRNETLPIEALAPTEKAYAYIATLAGRSSALILDQPNFQAAIECDDILNGHYRFTYRAVI